MRFQDYSIGRDPSCDIVLPDTSVSRKHAELTITATGEVYLTDAGSTNGVFVAQGGSWVTHRQGFVALTDQVKFGNYEIGVQALKAQAPHRPAYVAAVAQQQNLHGDQSVKRDAGSGGVIPK